MSDGLNEGQSEGLRDHLKQKREQKQQQQPRQRRLTYVAGLDGRRYVNDKILRNLEVKQHNHYGEYIAYATPEDVGAYQPYDPFQPIDPNELNAGYGYQQDQSADDDYHEIHQEDLTYQEPESHEQIETEEPTSEGAVTSTQTEAANPDLHNSFQKAQGLGSDYGHDATKAAPPSVPLAASTASHTPAGSREEYKKMLGGLFKDELEESPQPQSMPPQPPMEPDFSGAPQQLSVESQLSPQEKAVLQAAQQQGAPPAGTVSDARPPRKTISIQKSLLGDDDEVSSEGAQSPQAVQSRPKPSRIPIKIQRVAPPLPRQRNDEIYFEDNANSGKTAVFKMPKEGVVSSSRGTVELLVHKGGRMFRPHYNAVGILLRVDVSDGFSLVKGDTDKAHWLMTDRSGNPLDEEEIVGVAFDKKGNLWYETISGKKTKFLVSGGVEVTGDDQ